MAKIHESQIHEEPFGVRVFLGSPDDARELERLLTDGSWYGGRPIKRWEETPAHYAFGRPSMDVHLQEK